MAALSGGEIAGIVIGVLLAIALIVVCIIFLIRKVGKSRKYHGTYRPQLEEFHYAKDLPPIQPPAIEGYVNRGYCCAFRYFC
ncbi:hypothetical protein AB6A40_007881 [Gnathostoma spinigerum]|uniref:Uncharacterized protein n=1 Tax=Gnathostoma spinigerum TaxID=75299 RepID=A0ABD6EX69_9BILA